MSQANPAAEGVLRIAGNDRFIVYYGSHIASKTAELQQPTQNFSYHAVAGPRAALDGAEHSIDLSVKQPWQFVANIPLYDGTSDVLTNIVLNAGDPGLRGSIVAKGTATTDVAISYGIEYNGVNPRLGGPWNFKASAGNKMAQMGAWQ